MKEARTTAQRLQTSQGRNDAVGSVMIMAKAGKVEDLETWSAEAPTFG